MAVLFLSLVLFFRFILFYYYFYSNSSCYFPIPLMELLLAPPQYTTTTTTTIPPLACGALLSGILCVIDCCDFDRARAREHTQECRSSKSVILFRITAKNNHQPHTKYIDFRSFFQLVIAFGLLILLLFFLFVCLASCELKTATTTEKLHYENDLLRLLLVGK